MMIDEEDQELLNDIEGCKNQNLGNELRVNQCIARLAMPKRIPKHVLREIGMEEVRGEIRKVVFDREFIDTLVSVLTDRFKLKTFVQTPSDEAWLK